MGIDGQVDILIVDDQPENLLALEEALSPLGQNLVRAGSGKEALKCLLKRDFAVIILDVQMPGLDGFETARLIRCRQRSSHTPIIFLTAKYTDESDAFIGYAVGAVDYLFKPVVPEILRSKVSAFVELFKNNERMRLQSELLEQKSRQLREASRLKSEFLANMSHEIRTPMNAVIGMAELLLRTPLDDEQKEFTATIRESAQALLTIINDILDLSKIEAGKLDLEYSDFELTPLVEGVAELLTQEARSRNLSIITHVSPELPAYVTADATRIRQVLLNLVSNAVKFTPEGEIVVSLIPASGGDEDNVPVKFEVADTGIGLSPEQLRLLFQPFTQMDGSSVRRYGGTGLGLSISKRLVELMGGKIGVESKYGRGSTFWFTLPLRIAEGQPAPRSVPAEVSGARALIVDDQTASLKTIESYLTSLGLRCQTLSSAKGVVDKIKQAAAAGDAFRLIILDMVLPDADGLSLGKKLKEDGTAGDARLILLTAYDEKGLGETAVQSGFSAYLTKPFRHNHLCECVARVLSQPEAVAGGAPDRSQSLHPSCKSVAAGDEAAGARRKILVAEDNAVNQRVAVMQLQHLGYEASTVEDGKKAVDLALNGEFAAVLMDCQMPEMDGFEATSKIRLAEALTGQHIPIIGLTAQAMSGDREKCIASGMDDYLSKPVTLEKLRSTLDMWTSKKDERAEAEIDGGADDLYLSEVEWNLADLRQNVGDDAPGILAVFIDSAEGLLAGIQSSLDEDEFQRAELTAHELESTCWAVGARKLSRLSNQLANEARVRNRKGIEIVLEELRKTFKQSKSAMKRYMSAEKKAKSAR